MKVIAKSQISQWESKLFSRIVIRTLTLSRITLAMIWLPRKSVIHRKLLAHQAIISLKPKQLTKFINKTNKPPITKEGVKTCPQHLTSSSFCTSVIYYWFILLVSSDRIKSLNTRFKNEGACKYLCRLNLY